jgi:hypothetical protein
MLLNNKTKNWQSAKGVGTDENRNKNQGNLPEVGKPKKKQGKDVDLEYRPNTI